MDLATSTMVANNWVRSLPLSIRQQVRRSQIIFMQGGIASTVYYIERGRVELTAVSLSGQEATIALLSPGMFFGEACLTGETERLVTARALTDCSLISIEK